MGAEMRELKKELCRKMEAKKKTIGREGQDV